MYAPPGVKTNPDLPVPDVMKAWVLGDPGELKLTEKKVPVPRRAEVLVRIDAVAICATILEIIQHGPPALIEGGLPFNKNFTPGHEYMGTLRRSAPASTSTGSASASRSRFMRDADSASAAARACIRRVTTTA